MLIVLWLDVTCVLSIGKCGTLIVYSHTYTHKYLPFAEIPALPPLQHDPEPSEHSEQDSEWADSAKEQKFKRTSGPRTHDPYASDDSWFMPITVAVAVFLPVLFCLCRVRWIITRLFLGCLVTQTNHHRVCYHCKCATDSTFLKYNLSKDFYMNCTHSHWSSLIYSGYDSHGS